MLSNLSIHRAHFFLYSVQRESCRIAFCCEILGSCCGCLEFIGNEIDGSEAYESTKHTAFVLFSSSGFVVNPFKFEFFANALLAEDKTALNGVGGKYILIGSWSYTRLNAWHGN